jgi:hypothetical protein
MSQVLDREVSEGIPHDGRMFETPQVSIDNEQPRYVTFIGNLVERDAARQRKHLKGGGIEVANPCLRYVKNFIRKGRITPLLKDIHNFVSRDVVKVANQGDSSYFSQPIPAGYVAPLMSAPLNPANTPLMTKVALPGQQVESVVSGPEGVYARIGVVELKSLQLQPYRPQMIDGGLFVDPTIWQIQRTIFPDYPLFLKNGEPTVLLDDFEAILQEAWNTHSQLREVIEEMQGSVVTFRGYATATVEESRHKVEEIASKTQGYVPRYTPTDLLLFEQLGMQPRGLTKPQQQGNNLGEIKEMFSMFLQANREEREELTKQYEKRLALMPTSVSAPPVDENTMQATPEPVETVEAGASGQAGASGASGASGQSGAVTAEAAAGEPEPEKPLKGFAKINHDRKLAKEAAEKAAQQEE